MPRTLLAGGRVLDVSSGRTAEADVVLEGSYVADVGPGLDGDTSIDVAGLTLTPGLIDAHAHMSFAGPESLDGEILPSMRLLSAVPHLRRTLELGVTTVRDAWGADAGLRDAIAAGHVPGPRLLVSLAQLCGTGGIGDHQHPVNGTDTSFLGSAWLPRGVFDGSAEARSAVRRMLRADADVIKVGMSGSATMPATTQAQQIADDEIVEIVAEAARWGRHVMAHAHGARPAEAAARAGVRSIEHGWFLDEAAVTAMARHGTWLVPTLAAVHRDTGTSPPDWMIAARAASEHAFALALDAGIPIAMGTDCPMFPHGDRLDELAVMHRLGMSAEQVWRSATRDAARLLERDDLGRLEQGARADVVAIAGDPLDLEGLAGRVTHVWQDGRQVR